MPSDIAKMDDDATTAKDAPSVQETVLPDATVERRVIMKTDGVVLVGIVVITTLQFLDKNCLAYAAIMGLKTDTHLVGQEYSWLGSIFYFGYLLGMPLAAFLVIKFPVGRLLGTAAVCWGGMLMFMAACHNFAGLATVRFLLGVSEAPSLPCCMLLISTWWRTSEQPLRSALWYNTFAGIFGGPLAFAINRINGSLENWRYMFLIYGSITVLCGIAIALAVPADPAGAWFLTESEKQVAVVRLGLTQNSRVGPESESGAASRITAATIRWDQCREALMSLKYWTLIMFAFAQAITAAGITNFNPLIIQGFGYDTQTTNLLAAPQAAVGIVAQVSLSLLAYYFPNTRCLLWALGTLPALAGAAIIHSVDVNRQRSVALGGVYLMGFYNVGWVMAMAVATANTRGRTKRPFVNASIGVALAVGEIVGPQFFLEKQAPRYVLGIFALIVAYAVMVATGLLYWLLAVIANRERDRGLVGAGGREGVLGVDDDDATEVHDKLFRYSY